MLRCINRLETIDSGQILVDGVSVGNSRSEVRDLRKRVGMVFQSFNLFPHMSALKNVTLAPMLALGKSKEESIATAEALLAKVGLSNKKDNLPSQLSGGQQQRVAIARALAMNPEVMLFDEPTSSLDPELVGEVQNVIADLARDGMTMMIVTHGMSFAREVADTVIVMADGKILESGPPEEMFTTPQHRRTQSFLQSILGS
jgi:polar amino acid transport system ATP-binding protein